MRDDSHALVPFAKDGGSGTIVAPAVLEGLVAWSEQYGLDAYAGQTLVMYGQPYITEKGAVANAMRHPKYRGFSVALVATERMKEMKLDTSNDIAYECMVHMDGYHSPIVEYGEVTQAEVNAAMAKFGSNAPFLPLVKSPGKMARARAIRRAHLLAVPLSRQGLDDETETKIQQAIGGVDATPIDEPTPEREPNPSSSSSEAINPMSKGSPSHFWGEMSKKGISVGQVSAILGCGAPLWLANNPGKTWADAEEVVLQAAGGLT